MELTGNHWNLRILRYLPSPDLRVVDVHRKHIGMPNCCPTKNIGPAVAATAKKQCAWQNFFNCFFRLLKESPGVRQIKRLNVFCRSLFVRF